MFRVIPLLVVFFVSLGSSYAQVAVKLDSVKTDLIPGEVHFVDLTIYNHTGQILDLHNEGNNPWVMINLQAENGREITNMKVLNMPPIKLSPGKSTSARINLSQLYDLSREGFFRAYAVVYHAGTKQNYLSNKAFLNIRKGVTQWSQVVGVPKGMPREGSTCRFSVQTLSHKQGTDLYAVIEDAPSKTIIRAAKLGRWINLSKPVCKVDSRNILHIMFQNTASIFVHSRVDTSGKFGANMFYKRGNTTIPGFAMDANGQYHVINAIPFDPKAPIDKPRPGDEVPWRE